LRLLGLVRFLGRIRPTYQKPTTSLFFGLLFLGLLQARRNRYRLNGRLKLVGDVDVGPKGKGGKVFEIAADPSFEIRETSPDAFSPVEKVLPKDGRWRVPPAAVSAVELVTG
jgi:hypothetical protein